MNVNLKIYYAALVGFSVCVCFGAYMITRNIEITGIYTTYSILVFVISTVVGGKVGDFLIKR